MQSVFVIVTKLVASKIYFCKEVFCNNFGCAGNELHIWMDIWNCTSRCPSRCLKALLGGETKHHNHDELGMQLMGGMPMGGNGFCAAFV